MYGRPPVTARAIHRTILVDFGVEAYRVERLTSGHDAHAWAYRVEAADGTVWFAKVREGAPTPASILVPQHLSRLGLDAVVAPVSTLTGAPWATIGTTTMRAPTAQSPTLILAPFVAGTLAVDRPLDDAQWHEYGEFLGALHAVRLPQALERRVPRETFRPYNASLVRMLASARPLPARGPARPVLAVFWSDHAERIERLLARAAELGRHLAEDPPLHSVCHADIHRANILVDTAGRLRVVDWDGVVLAPRERDLMFIIDGIIAGPPINAHEQAMFMEGYGPAEPNPVGLAYYRHAWAIQDIGEFVEQVLRRGPVSAAERAEALSLLVGQLDADGQVPAAEAGWDAVARRLPGG